MEDSLLTLHHLPLKKNTPDIDFSKAQSYYFAFSLGAGYKPFKKKALPLERTLPQEELPTVTNDSIPAEANVQKQEF